MGQSVDLRATGAMPDCPFRDFQPCLGPGCMAWSWVGSTRERQSTTNLVETPDGLRPHGELLPPEGDGWKPSGPPYKRGYHRSAKDGLPPALEQWWERPVERTRGRCGRVSGYDADDEVPF